MYIWPRCLFDAVIPGPLSGGPLSHGSSRPPGGPSSVTSRHRISPLGRTLMGRSIQCCARLAVSLGPSAPARRCAARRWRVPLTRVDLPTCGAPMTTTRMTSMWRGLTQTCRACRSGWNPCSRQQTCVKWPSNVALVCDEEGLCGNDITFSTRTVSEKFVSRCSLVEEEIGK